MKNQLSLSILLVTACLLLSSSLNAQVSKIVDVATAGTLPTLITGGEKDQITHLTVTGDLNGTDIRFIREMAGKNVINEKTAGKLSVLDLSQANIVSGGDYYYKDNREGIILTDSRIRNTSDNVIGRVMFDSCTGLTEIVLPNSITSIAAGAFEGCTGLTSLIIPDNVTSIGIAAFSGCSSLTSLTIGSNVTSIGLCAFIKCTGLTSLTFGNRVTTIGLYAFSHCIGLTSVRIPNNVTNIDDCAFFSCSGLTSVTIGSGVKSIGCSVFQYCQQLKEIGVSEENTSYCQVDGVLYSKDKTTLIECPNARSGNYTILKGVDSIGKDAFSGCDRLISIKIPKSVTSIGGYAFSKSSLKQIHCDALKPPSFEKSARLILDIEKNDAFYAFKETCTLFVPKGRSAAYKKADGWKTFKSIVEE